MPPCTLFAAKNRSCRFRSDAAGRDGWEITRIVRSDEKLAGIPIIMLTAHVEDTDKIVGLELGADDYVPKPFNPRELVARVRSVLRRTSGEVSPPRILRLDALEMDVDQHTIRAYGQPVELTPTEFSLLHLLLENPTRAFSRTELIEKGLGYAYEGMERTIDSHIKNLRKKLGVEPGKPGYIETVYGIGYRLLGEA